MQTDFAIYELNGVAHLDIVMSINGGEWQQVAGHKFATMHDAWEMARLLGIAA